MKNKTILLALVSFLMISLASCSFETVSTGCPAYSHQNKMTRHGSKAQHHYQKKTTHNRW